MTHMSILLIGYRGSGKTTVGRKLAAALSDEFLDTDELIVRQAGGKSIKDIFSDEGENGFRDRETGALLEVLRLDDHVIALGGGAVLRDENRAMIKASGHKVFYLHCDADELHRRIAGDPNSGTARPALTTLGGGVEEIRELLVTRLPIYRLTMTSELDVTHLSADDVVQVILKML